ncbi:hypothetical protein [Bernardetia sp.]|uniref:hypothetical protein n=1 Tax=Bernardetia sp. TaxID=1937974 RepID=UPI0025C0CF87|nr:hypothetical protein [Bernardetia sp.]
MKKTTLLLVAILLLSSNSIFAQNFLYKREIKGIENSKQTEWYKLILPTQVTEKASTDFSDVRIFGVDNTDTVEVPFLINKLRPTFVNSSQVDFKIINTAKKEQEYFFTLEKTSDTEEAINLIKLNFENDNFDWKVKLEGSQNQNEWFEILKDYRIVSIKNDFTDYSFTNLAFASSKYKYYRLRLSDQTNFQKNEPKLASASIFLQEIVEGSSEDLEVVSKNLTIDKEKKQTVIDFEIAYSAVLDVVSLEVKNDFDYYRKIQFKYLLDSTKTEKGVIYNFVTLHTSTLSSLEKENGVSDFSLNPNVKAKKYQIIIDNQDNQPLDIGKVGVKVYTKELFARVSPSDKNRSYFLAYGNERIQKPNYDITRFENTIPNDLTSLILSDEEKIPQKEVEKVKPLFENSLWLWFLMGAIIVVLTFFTFKMMKK